MGVASVLVGIGVVATGVWLVRRTLGRRASTAAIPIVDPRWAVLDFSGGTAAEDIAQDRSALEPILGSPQMSRVVAATDVLFIYGRVAPDGRIENAPASLRELIRDSGAKVVVLASSNDPQACMNAAPNVGYGRANLVLTIDRRRSVFGRFFAQLFTLMYTGATMPMAWVTLAPQGPVDHPNAPEAVFGAEVGQLTFMTSNKALNPTGLRPAG